MTNGYPTVQPAISFHLNSDLSTGTQVPIDQSFVNIVHHINGYGPFKKKRCNANKYSKLGFGNHRSNRNVRKAYYPLISRSRIP